MNSMPSRLNKVQQSSSVNRIIAWFKPYFRERVALMACGVMIVMVAFFKPTFDEPAKSLAKRVAAASKQTESKIVLPKDN